MTGVPGSRSSGFGHVKSVLGDEVELSRLLDDSGLREVAERYELVMRASAEGLWDWDLTSGVVRYSTRWKQQIGYDPHEIGASIDEWRTRLHPDDRERADAAIDGYLANRIATYEVEYRLRHKDGSWRWLRATGAALRDEHGRPYRFAGAQADIHARKLAEEQARESERTLHTLLHNLPGMAFRVANLPNWPMEFVSDGASELTGYRPVELLGGALITYNDLIHPDDRPSVQEEIGRAIAERRPFRMNYRLITRDGQEKWVWEQGQPIWAADGALEALEGFCTDITLRVRSYELLEQRVAERTRELSLLLDVSRALVVTLELEPLLERVLDQLHVVVDYDAASVLLVQDDRLMQMIANRRSPESATVRDYTTYHFPIDWEVNLWQRFRRGEAIVIGDVRGPGAAAEAYRLAVGARLVDEFTHVTSWMGIPLVVKERLIGMVALSHPRADYYTAHHAQVATGMANFAAIAIDNARLHERTREIAAIEERQRLARELHDSVSQALYGIGLGARTARALLDRDPARIAEPLDYVLQLAEAGLAEMRALIFELRPESLAAEGLIAALEKHAAALRARYAIAVDATLPVEPEAALPVKEALYRIAQEALHNTVKHGRASRVDLRLTKVDGQLELLVSDDGVGFDPDGSFPGHLGLTSMRERAERLGGWLAISSRPGAGTRVRASVPAQPERVSRGTEGEPTR